MSDTLSQTQAGYYLQGLLSRLKTVIPKRQHANIECWMEGVEIMLGAKNQGQGRDIGYISYTAQFSFEKFPFQQIDPAVIIANVIAWLEDNDQHREDFAINDPSFDIEAQSETTVLISLEVEFIEPLMVIADEDGTIYWQEATWSLAPYEIWVAEHGSIAIANTMASS